MSPVVVRNPDDADTCAVTFRWDGPDTEVLLLLVARPRELAAHRLRPTEDGLALTLVLPSRLCSSYRFVVGGLPAEADDAGLWALAARGVPDPAEPERIGPVFGGTGEWSVLTLPDADVHPAWDPATRAHPGTWWDDTAPATAVLPARRVRTWLPPGERPGTVVVLLDGDDWADGLGLRAALDRWSTRGVAVAVVSTADRAVLDQRTTMRAVLVEQLLPLLDERLGAPRPRLVVAGQSYGGLAAAGLAVDEPDLVHTCLAQSGSFWFDPAAADSGRSLAAPGELTRGAVPPTVRFVLEVGSEEGPMVDQTRWFADAARAAGAHVVEHTVCGGHDHAWYRHALLHALDRLPR